MKRALPYLLLLAMLMPADAGVVGDSFTQTVPTPGVTVGPTWASNINDVLTELITRVSADIDSASINITTGDVRHSTRNKQFGAAFCHSGTATWTPGTGATGAYWLGGGAANTVECAFEMDRNQRITAVRMTGRSVATAWTFRLWRIDHSAGTRTQLGATQTSGTATSIEELSITGLTETVDDNENIVAEWTSGAASTRMLAVEISYDRTTAN